MLLKCHDFTSFLMCCPLVYRHVGDSLKCVVSFFAAVTDDELYAGAVCMCLCVAVFLLRFDPFRTYVHTGAKSHSSALKAASLCCIVIIVMSQSFMSQC